MLLTSRAVVASALTRTESRGAHYRLDFPYRDDRDWLRNTFIRGKGKDLEITTRPIRLLRYKPQPISKFGLEVRS